MRVTTLVEDGTREGGLGNVNGGTQKMLCRSGTVYGGQCRLGRVHGVHKRCHTNEGSNMHR